MYELSEIENTEPTRLYKEAVEGLSQTSYILSSSGTTGLKKWIPIQGRGLEYWAKVKKNLMNLNERDKILSTRSPAYDARIAEYVIAFAGMGCLYLMDNLSRKDLASIQTACTNNQITTIILIASQLNNNHAAELLQSLKTAGLNHLLVTGDACSPLVVNLCEQLAINLWNCYGPTEATFGMSMIKANGKLQQDEQGQFFAPIGEPELPVKAHIIEGEIYIESPFLSSGYLGCDEAINTTAFPIMSIQGENIRVFRPGDKFYRSTSQMLCFAGRASEDSHAKVNGVKISPYAIQQCLNNYEPDNLHAAVVIKPWLKKDKPFAYIVLKKPIDKTEFITYLKKRLKKEEFPIIIQIENFPFLTISQKIDKQALIKKIDEPDSYFLKEKGSRTKTAVDPVLAQYQQELTAIWSNLFNMDKIDLSQDFILLGGDSLLATELCLEIQLKINKQFRYRDLLSMPVITIESISNHLLNPPEVQIKVLIKQLYTTLENNDNLFFLPPLLGEGYFTYRNLSMQLGEILNCNIYGLTDPGIFNENDLPLSLEDAANRYIQAIQTIQPQGPYEIAGFSFGATLAAIVAEKLQSQGEIIKKLHLLDGFPPFMMQQLKKKEHAYLLKSLIRFVILTLNNNYYNQSITPTVYKGLDEVTPLKQIETTFNHLLSEINPQLASYEEARCLLLIAKRHIAFMRTAKLPEKKSSLTPVLYLTDLDQPYLAVIAGIEPLSKSSADHNFFYWNRYYHHLRRNGVELKIQHNELLLSLESQMAKVYFQFSYDKLFNFAHDVYRLNVLYQLKNDQLQLFFVPGILEDFYIEFLTALGLIFQVVPLHKSTYYRYEKVLNASGQIFLATSDTFANRISQNDLIYSRLFCLTAPVPVEKQEAVEHFLKQSTLTKKLADRSGSSLEVSFKSGNLPITLHFLLMWDTVTLFTVDLALYIENWPEIPTSACCRRAQDRNAIYFIHFSNPDLFELDAVLEEAEIWLFQMIQSLQPCLTPNTTKANTFFSNRTSQYLTKKYQLTSQNQASYEKGLRQAVVNNNIEDVKKFITLVKNINAQDTNPAVKRTALHWAALKGHADCYILLLKAGAKDDIFDANNNMPEDYVFEYLNTMLLPYSVR